MKTLDKEFTSKKIQAECIFTENERIRLRFAALDVIIDPQDRTITEEYTSVSGMDSSTRYSTIDEFEKATKNYVWLFNN